MMTATPAPPTPRRGRAADPERQAWIADLGARVRERQRQERINGIVAYLVRCGWTPTKARGIVRSWLLAYEAAGDEQPRGRQRRRRG